MSSQPSKPTPHKPSLLSLPAELRNIIYYHVLGSTTYTITCTVRIPWGVSVKNTTQKHHLALLLTNRQIYSETHLLPLHLNTFHFSSEDAFKPWLAKFDKHQQAAIANVHLVTWKAKHMLERRGFAPRRLVDVFPVEVFKGLRKVTVEVRYTGMVKECEKWECEGSELEDENWGEQEGRLRLRWKRHDPRLVIEFDRVAV